LKLVQNTIPAKAGTHSPAPGTVEKRTSTFAGVVLKKIGATHYEGNG
jgi:hypothetical protein